ncbi:D-beta-hydroxybutyrate dehydrogenase, mitochondrial-like [Babylonia areolata]|uniref:D-beta-hydroxybutyrate dehydrogenase, mitochondrial-like n=1 Tax=Babylonia areolata TaxID=304850 RepID=UPI003FD41ABF
MELKQFLGLQVFEFAYLMALAFLPFFVAQREVGLSILFVAVVYVVISGLKMALTGRIDPANKVVVITGCDSGFGNALARRLSSLGMTVVAGCYDKASDGAQLLKSEAKGQLHVVPLDVRDEDSVQSCVTYVQDMFPGKGVWAVVNNAGVLERGNVELTPLDMYRKVAEVNLFGAIRFTKAFLPLLRPNKGRVVNVIGAEGRLSLPSMSALSVSSHGLEAFSDALRMEMKQFGVKVVVVEPGNYFGATGFQNRAALPRIQEELRSLWAEADGSVRQVYGNKYVDSQYKAIADHSKTAPTSLAPVIDTMEGAVLQVRVRARYLVDGSNQLIDLPNFLIRWGGWLPQLLKDRLLSAKFIQKARVTHV